jgi:hypothetical protein
MRKTYPLRPEGKHPDRVLDAIKHDIRKYLKRERRRELPEGMHFWDFDCRFGASQEVAHVLHVAALIGELDTLAKTGAEQAYVEILARPAIRLARDPASDTAPAPVAQSADVNDPPASPSLNPAA